MGHPNSPSSNYKDARTALDAAVAAYKANPNVETLVAIYEAQNAARAAANAVGTGGAQAAQFDAKTVSKTIALLQQNEPVPGAGLGTAQALLAQLQNQASSGVLTMEQTRALSDAQRQLEQYIQVATARVQDDDSQFADEYMRLTGQAPPPGRFSSAQTINGTTPTPAPSPGGATPEFGITSAPDEGVRPEEVFPVPDAGVRPEFVRPREKAPKRKAIDNGTDDSILVETLPDYSPYDIKQDYRASGLDIAPGTPGPVGASDSINSADQVIRMSQQAGTFQAGRWFGANRDAVKSARLVFTGYQTRSSKYIDPDNPRFGSQIVNTKTPTYQAVEGLRYALGKGGFPTVAEYQKAMGLPVTGALNDQTMNAWMSTVNEAAMNTAANQPGMTIQQAMANQIRVMEILAAKQRAAMAAAYNVDPTASAAILGSAMKQVTGRLSTAGEDSEFHRAFNSANISTQGKVDAQQFARDWVRNKYPTEAGTMAGQDYYGAMFDVLTSGPGSLGSEAADING